MIFFVIININGFIFDTAMNNARWRPCPKSSIPSHTTQLCPAHSHDWKPSIWYEGVQGTQKVRHTLTFWESTNYLHCCHTLHLYSHMLLHWAISSKVLLCAAVYIGKCCYLKILHPGKLAASKVTHASAWNREEGVSQSDPFFLRRENYTSH